MNVQIYKTNITKNILPIFFGLSITLVGCNPFAPSLVDGLGGGDNILTDQTTTDGVFKNFSYAYNFKDSLVYSDLLDSSFLFISKDFSTTPVTNLTWGRDTDLRTTSGLFNHFQTLNLIWDRTKSQRILNEDSTEQEVLKTFQLTFEGGKDYPTFTGESLFILRKHARSSKDTTKIWTITRWEDLSRF